MRLTKKALLFIAVAALALVLSLSRAFIRGANTQDAVGNATSRIALLERRDTISQRQALTRQCSRLNLDRAEVQLHARNERVIEHRLPILDCTPNLRGLPARVLPAAEQRKFVRDYAAGRLDPVTGR